MGKDAQVNAVFSDGPDAGRLQFEAGRLTFRGRQRRVFDALALTGLKVDGPDLVLHEGSRFRLGEVQATRWFEAIAHPKSRLEKMGLKPGHRVAILWVDDGDLGRELEEGGAILAEAELDLLFVAVDQAEDLDDLEALVARLSPRGALWVISRKGKTATIRDVDIMGVCRPAGLVDTKVVGFSDTHTALRFVRRR
jgi:hypothetical protein